VYSEYSYEQVDGSITANAEHRKKVHKISEL